MSLLKINPRDINGFKLTKSGKMIKMPLQNLLNQDDETIGFVEVQLFGIGHVYTLVNFSKLKRFNISNIISSRYNPVYFPRDLGEYEIPFYIAKMEQDCPIEYDVNVKSNILTLDNLNQTELILLYQLKNMIDGMNYISEREDNLTYEFEFGDIAEEDECPFELSKLDFDVHDEDSPFCRYKYILKYPDGKYEFSNEIYNDEFEGIFVYLSNFNCWQYLSKKKYCNLKRAKEVDIRYATTDNPRCFSDVRYYQEYNIDTFIDLILYGIYIPLNIYFDKLFNDDQKTDNRYDAIEINIEGREYRTSVLLTHAELGIDKFFSSGENKKRDPFEHNRFEKCIRFIDKFCLLTLINKIILLKP